MNIRKSHLIPLWTLGFVGGLLVSFWGGLSLIRIMASLCLAVALFAFGFLDKRFLFGFSLIFFFSLGLLRGGFARSGLVSVLTPPQRLFSGGFAVFTGRVEETEERLAVREAVVSVHHFYFPRGENWRGRILLQLSPFSALLAGDEIKVIGKLKIPTSQGNFDYRDFLNKKGIFFLMRFPYVRVTERPRGGLRSIFAFLRKKLSSALQKLYLPPQSQFLAAVLMGKKNLIDKELRENFTISGTRHIIAISGLHISILMGLFFGLFLLLGLSKGLAACLTVLWMGVYILLVGSPFSAVRSLIMGSFFIFALVKGLSFSGENLLFAAAFLTLIIDPEALWNVGFQLSYLAVLGIIYFKRYFDRFLRRVPNLFKIRDILSVTLSAQILILPLVSFYFGRISIISPLTNVLILPVLPLALIGSFLSVLLGSFFLPLGFLLSWVNLLFVDWILFVVSEFSLPEFASVNIRADALFLVIYLAVFLILANLPKILEVQRTKSHPHD